MSQCFQAYFLLLQWPVRDSLVHCVKTVCCRELSWEAATERMLDAAEIGPGDWPKAATKVAEATLFFAYNAALGMPRFRQLSCCASSSALVVQKLYAAACSLV